MFQFRNFFKTEIQSETNLKIVTKDILINHLMEPSLNIKKNI